MERSCLQPAARGIVRPSDGLVQSNPTGNAAAELRRRKKRGQFFGGEFHFEPWANAYGWLTAFDAATGKQRWQYRSGKPMIGSVAVTGGDVVFAGELTGDFLALDARDGKVVFKHPLDGPAAGGLVSYASRDRQYVAVVSGFVGGYYNQMAPEIGGGNPTITVFALKP